MAADISWIKIPLPDDILCLKTAGHFDGARQAIDHMLTGYLPTCMKQRLELEKIRLDLLDGNEYPYSDAAALALLEEHFTDFQAEELPALVAASAADWIYLNGERRFHDHFLRNIIKTRPDYAARLKSQDAVESGALNMKLLDDNVVYMAAHGGRTVRLTIRASLQIKKEFERLGQQVRVHLPLPRAARQNSEIRILETSHPAICIAPEDAPQRTLCFETALRPDEVFSVTYSYINHVDYVCPDPNLVTAEHPDECLEEQAPHILFTPFLEELLAEIKGQETNVLLIARRIYDFITTRVKYSFVREYAGLDNISEYAARNLKGDCGVQALLFITLCRMAGIPARWQSGLYASQLDTGCHDWAEFYVAPYGWLYTDLSFGGSAWREGKTMRHNYYFGNLDIFRMAANCAIQSPLTPPKRHFRADPIDNQRGEVEYEDEGLTYRQFVNSQQTLSMEEL